MGLLFNDTNEIKEKVKNNFGDDKNYLVTIKHNDAKSGFAKLITSNLFYTLDSSRTFILYFSPKGIYEKEISNSSKGNFSLIPSNEIEDFELLEKSKKSIINFLHLGKKVSYEIPYEGKIFVDNKENIDILKENDWNIV